jgi:hypothetical protein
VQTTPVAAVPAGTIQTAPASGNHATVPPATAGAGGETSATKSDGLFAALKDVLPVLAIYSYFAGWIYAFAFYKAFRVPVSSLDIPFQYFFMYSFSALATWKGGLILLGTIVVVSWLRNHRIIMAATACVLFALLFGVAFAQGTGDATLQRHTTANDRIVLAFKQDAAKSLQPDLVTNNDAERLRLLTETKDRILVFYQPPAIGTDFPPALVYDVAKSDVVTLKRQVTDKQAETLRETLWRLIHEQPAK